jgi:4-amino-4-deoxy-L-arabinose transferase-like glycosyltransferase
MRRETLSILLILALAAALRTLYLSNPYLDAHGWRQVDTAAIARNFYEGSLNPFAPRVDWGGADGRVETEFPLVPLMAALAGRVFGFTDVIARLPVIGFALGLILAVYWLAIVLDGRRSVAIAAAFFMAIAPSAVFFGRTLMPDTPMLACAVLALAGFAHYGRTGASRSLWIGSAAFGFACLIKIPAIVIAIPIAVALLQSRGLGVFGDWRVWIAVVVPLTAVVGWYWHAWTLFKETGLTFGILAHPAKTYPGWIAPGPWPGVFSKWSTSDLLTSWDFYERMFARLYHFHLTPVGLALASIGLYLWRGWGRFTHAAWLLAMVAFVLVAGEGHRAHDYYQLPFAAIGAIYIGVSVSPLFDGAWLRERVQTSAGRVGLYGLITALGLLAFYYSGVTQTHFRSLGLDTRTLAAGRAIDAHTDDGALAVVVDDYGITSPMLFYFARLKGWSFDVGDLTPTLIESLRRRGARYFATTQWGRIEREKPETAGFLLRHEELPLPGAPPDAKLFRVR